MANILLKTGADSLSDQTNIWLRIFSWEIISGLTLYGLSAIIYIIILRWLPLNIAQSFAAAQFIFVIIASWLFLGESISLVRLAGISLIALGIVIIGFSR